MIRFYVVLVVTSVINVLGTALDALMICFRVKPSCLHTYVNYLFTFTFLNRRVLDVKVFSTPLS